MSKKVIIVTGAAGFLGSSLVVELTHDYKIVALDIRQPSADLRNSTPEVVWHKGDVSSAADVTGIFEKASAEFGQIEYIIHLAAYYHFGNDWRQEYTKTNIVGTENVLRAAAEHRARRIIFASSIAAMEPLPDGHLLTEQSPTSHYLPYARSKAVGEEIVRRYQDRLSSIVLRFAGVFSDWCELPPLFSLIRLWTSLPIINRTMPGDGRSGMPYLHLCDAVRLFKCCLDEEVHLDKTETLLAAPHGTTLHNEIYRAVRKTMSRREPPNPIRVPPPLARPGLAAKAALEKLRNRPSYLHPWMADYIDRPWVVDNRLTEEKLTWRCTPGMGILERVPKMLGLYSDDRKSWLDRNTRRNQARFLYMK